MNRKRRRRRKPSKEEAQPTSGRAKTTAKNDQPGPFYRAGPAISLKSAGRGDVNMEGQEEEEKQPAGPVPAAKGSGVPEHEEAYASSVRLQGRTDADYDGGSFHTENVTVEQAEGCDGCSGPNCIHATGNLVATYSVATTVTLPSADDFPDLTPCQRSRVQDAINNVLAPHEQQHVRAFHQYDGTTSRPFDLTLCRTDFDRRIQEMFTAEEQQRRAAAQAASDALDPFHFDVDIDCEEEVQEEESAAPTMEPPDAAPEEEENA